MLTRRIIPCLDVTGGRVVKGQSFLNLRDAGDPVALAKYYYEQGADELAFLDITATVESRKTMAGIIAELSKHVFMPLTVGGGIRTIADMREMLLSGADKVAINTAAVARPELITEGALKFGSQCIVVAIDAKRAGAGKWVVRTHSATQASGLDAVAWARKAAEMGAGELLVTSIDSDGQKTGYDNELNRAISESVPVPLIASGGAGTLEHIFDAFDSGRADAALAASIFHYGTYSISQVKDYLAQKGIAVRR
ncbi:imidazole glycerol phosphate synthase subunit HisF [Dehalogenimonas alkenigignens]|uniref:Imidazole glycerol phosphate synthase subunit HisF n=1 Tax=Dehalogenimonas alkenigignens TaxID=1217799 RepID=A0A0W0GIN0_9CHLR|nr:imidazole glycerol phosphate synthase subunit HisF [Dehalogenimonas alkenigignens]KTB48409.1 imidazole glycerol phosphate synthase subunit hisF [Dehalogenimonas alkenigignens]PVV85133.1 imidazole glycerol phosphate synthase subunit HisF [Dehalogenimonas alkenigignens]